MFFRRERFLFLLVCPLRISLQLRGHGLLLVQTVGVGSRFRCRASLSEISFSYFDFRCWISMSGTSQNPFKSESLLLSLIEVLARDLGIQSDGVCVFGFFKEIWCCLIHSTIWRLNCCFNCFVLAVDRFEFLNLLALWRVLFFIIRKSLRFQVTYWSVVGCFSVILRVWLIVVVVTFTGRFDCLEKISFIWLSCLLLSKCCKVLLFSGCNFIKSVPVLIPKRLDSRSIAYA